LVLINTSLISAFNHSTYFTDETSCKVAGYAKTTFVAPIGILIVNVVQFAGFNTVFGNVLITALLSQELLSQ
jgi:hypothetical protein